MSNTHKDKTKMKIKREHNAYRREFSKIVRKERKRNDSVLDAFALAKFKLAKKNPYHPNNIRKYKYEHVEVDYSKNPGWWNHEFNRVPKRRHDRDNISKITIGQADDVIDFSLDRKPNKYYW